MHRFVLPSLVLYILLILNTITVFATDRDEAPKGLWTNKKQTVAVEIASCADDERLCGRIVWLKKPYQDDGSLKRDQYNPEPDLRDQSLCNLEILSGFSEYGENRWEHGRIYNPEEGQIYRASLELVSEDELRVRGYIFMPIFGKTQVWERISAAPGDCPGGDDPMSPLASDE